MAGRLASPRDLAILVATHHLRSAADRDGSGELGRHAREVAEQVARAVDSVDGAEAVACLRAAGSALEGLRAAAFRLFKDDDLHQAAFDDVSASSVRCRAELDGLAPRLRGRAWLRLTSGGLDESPR